MIIGQVFFISRRVGDVGAALGSSAACLYGMSVSGGLPIPQSNPQYSTRVMKSRHAVHLAREIVSGLTTKRVGFRKDLRFKQAGARAPPNVIRGCKTGAEINWDGCIQSLAEMYGQLKMVV